MKFSLVIITLNEEKYISTILQSLATQNFKDFEVIVVDGLSKDETVAKAKQYMSRLNLKIIYVRQKGISRARNAGGRAAKHDNLLFLDADTRFSKDFLQKFSRQLHASKPDYASVWNSADTKNIAERFLFGFFSTSMYLTQKFYPFISGACFYCTRKAFKKSKGFDEKAVWAEDMDLARRMQREGLKFRVFTQPQIYVSSRRIKEMGPTRFMLTYLFGGIFFALMGPIRRPEKFKYEFGHHKL